MPLRIETVPIASLTEDPNNAMRHPAENLRRIRASIQRFGQVEPLVVMKDTGVVIGGNGRLEAMKSMNCDTVDVVRYDGTESEARALALALNASAEGRTWDVQLLADHLESLPEELRNAAGWDERGLALALRDAEKEVESDSEGEDMLDPQGDGNYRSKDGDLWVVDAHRVVCGDSTKSDILGLLLGDDQPDLMVTDPPYGVDYVGKTEEKLEVHNDGAEGLSDLLMSVLPLSIERLKDGGSVYVFAPPGPPFLDFAVVLRGLDVWRQTLVWAKDRPVMGRLGYHCRHEAIFYGWKPGEAHLPPTDRKQDTIWEFSAPNSSRDHPTMKPVELIEHALRMSSAPGDLVLDPFGGSGTTAVAAVRTKRLSATIELSPRYCDVILQRLEEATGKEAVRIE